MATKLDTLYYEIEARTTGFGKSLDEAERRVGKLADFIQRRPAVAAGAATAAIVSIGVAATKMAADVEREGRKLGDVFPRVARQAEALSNEFGVAQTGVIDLFETIRERGARTPEGITNTATAVLQLNQALHGTPDQVDALAGSLSDVRDLFHVPTGQEGTLAATLFAMANGKVPLGDFLADLQAAAPTISSLGLSLNQVGPALVHFREEGLNTSKQVASALKDLVNTQGPGSLGKFAADAVTAADAQKQFNDQLARTSEEMGTTGDRVRERFNNAMIDLGTKILPFAARWLENVATLMDRISGRSSAFDSLGKIAEVANADYLNGNTAADRAYFQKNGIASGDRFGRQTTARNAVLNLQEQITDGDFSLLELGTDRLKALRTQLTEISRAVRDGGTQQALGNLLNQINMLLAQSDSGVGAGNSHGGNNAGQSKVDTLTAQLHALTDSVGAVALDKLKSLQHEVEAALASPGDLGAAATRQLRALDNQIKASIGTLTEYQKANEQAMQAAQAIKDQARAGSPQDLKDAQLAQAAQDHLKQMARDEVAKQDAMLADALHRTKEEAAQSASNVQGQARAIEQAVAGALDLAKAFGLVDDATQSIMVHIAQVALGIGPLVDAIQKMEKGGKNGGLAGAANVIGAALPVVGGLISLGSSLFGPTPEEKALREAQVANTRALQALTVEVGNLGLAGVTGNQFTAAKNAAGNVDIHSLARTDAGAAGYGMVNQGKYSAYLASQGTSADQLQKLADQLGLQVDFTTDNLATLQAAFKTLNAALAKVELTQFAQTFDGQMQAFQASLSLFDVTDPLQKLARLLDVIRSGVGSPALAGAFAGIDVTSAAGRAEANRRLQDLFAKLQSGTLDPAALGGLTGQEFLDQLTQIHDLLNQVAGASAGQSQSWVVNRSITEVRGARLEDLLGSIDLWAQEIADNTGIIADILSRLDIAGGSLRAPTAGADGTYLGGGAGITIGQLIVQVAAGVDPGAAGAAAAQAFVRGVDQALGTRSQVRTAYLGEAA